MAFGIFRTSSSLTDDELMGKIAEGCSDSFNVLFERHGPKVFGYAKKILGDHERAEDVSQEIWVKVVQQAPSYSKEGYFKAWVSAYYHVKQPGRKELRACSFSV